MTISYKLKMILFSDIIINESKTEGNKNWILFKKK